MFAASNNDIFDFNNFVPYPDAFREKDEANKKDSSVQDGYNDGGYEWCIKNYGTKWKANSPTISTNYLSKCQLLYFFDTAWSPSIPITKKASELFPELIFEHRYSEEGIGIKGKIIFNNGVEVSSWEK